jgi:hypothetical protein
MNRLILAIMLQDEHARPLRVIRIILDDDRSVQAFDDIAHRDAVRGKLFVPVERYAHIAVRHERSYLFQSVGHPS